MKTILKLLWFFAAGVLLGYALGETLLAEPERYRLVAGCTLVEETATANSRSELSYFNCDNHVVLMLKSDSINAQVARSLLGRSGDIKFEPVGAR